MFILFWPSFESRVYGFGFFYKHLIFFTMGFSTLKVSLLLLAYNYIITMFLSLTVVRLSLVCISVLSPRFTSW